MLVKAISSRIKSTNWKVENSLNMQLSIVLLIITGTIADDNCKLVETVASKCNHSSECPTVRCFVFYETWMFVTNSYSPTVCAETWQSAIKYDPISWTSAKHFHTFTAQCFKLYKSFLLTEIPQWICKHMQHRS